MSRFSLSRTAWARSSIPCQTRASWRWRSPTSASSPPRHGCTRAAGHTPARQLYYAVCADVETVPTRVASGEVGLGVLLILIGAITGQRILLAVLGLARPGVADRRRASPTCRSAARCRRRGAGDRRSPISSAASSAWRQTYAGLVVATALPPPSVAHRWWCAIAPTRRRSCTPTASGSATSASPSPRNLPLELGGRRVIALHDCDPAGCALSPPTCATSVRTSSTRASTRRSWTGRRLQLLEGAPARLPRDLSGHLDAAQLDWLRSGRRLECATETPEQLAQRVRAALVRRLELHLLIVAGADQDRHVARPGGGSRTSAGGPRRRRRRRRSGAGRDRPCPPSTSSLNAADCSSLAKCEPCRRLLRIHR